MNETRCMVRSLDAPVVLLLRGIVRSMHALPRGHGLAVSRRASDRTRLGRKEDLDLLNSVAENIMGRTICALGDAAAMPVRGMLKHFWDEFEYHVEHKHCLVDGHAHHAPASEALTA